MTGLSRRLFLRRLAVAPVVAAPVVAGAAALALPAAPEPVAPVPEPAPAPDTFDYEGAIAEMEAAGIALAAVYIKGKCEGFAVRDPGPLRELRHQIMRGGCPYRLGEDLASQSKWSLPPRSVPEGRP